MINPDEYIRYTGEEIPFSERHDGMLRWVTGAQHVQVFRASRKNTLGGVYNHAPHLIYCHNRFYCHWITNPVSEHVGKSQTLLVTSDNGYRWSHPVTLFPPYPLDLSVDNGPMQDLYEEGNAFACMHQRMGFYIANERLLALGYYGLSPEVPVLPCVGRGIGRVVREIYADGSFGPVYFLLMNHSGGYDEKNVLYPMYTSCYDTGFVDACRRLLQDKLAMLQMWEENRDCEDDVFSLRGVGEAFNHYRLDDGTVVGLWKHARVSMSKNNGNSWLPVKKCPSLVMSGGKIWGQRLSDGRYVLVYNPVSDSCHRWPLAVVTSEDGINFSNMLCLMGEVPAQRYWGFWRDYGPQYVRGMECDTQPPDGGLWLAYSMNKEDIWVSRIDVPVSGIAAQHSRDDFSVMETRENLCGWHTYSPKWCGVSLEARPMPENPNHKALRLRHKDPYDYAKAVRVFPESVYTGIRLQVEARQNYFGRLEIEIADKRGLAVFRIIFGPDRVLWLKHGNGVTAAALYGYGVVSLNLTVNCREQTTDASITQGDNTARFTGLRFFGNVRTVERIVFRTGTQRIAPRYDEDVEFMPPVDLPDSEEPLTQEAVYYVHGVETNAADFNPVISASVK